MICTGMCIGLKRVGLRVENNELLLTAQISARCFKYVPLIKNKLQELRVMVHTGRMGLCSHVCIYDGMNFPPF